MREQKCFGPCSGRSFQYIFRILMCLWNYNIKIYQKPLHSLRVLLRLRLHHTYFENDESFGQNRKTSFEKKEKIFPYSLLIRVSLIKNIGFVKFWWVFWFLWKFAEKIFLFPKLDKHIENSINKYFFHECKNKNLLSRNK